MPVSAGAKGRVHKTNYRSVMGTHIIFWVIMHCFLFTLIFLAQKAAAESEGFVQPFSYWITLLLGGGTGIIPGFIFGTLEYFLEKKYFTRKSLGTIILLRLLVTQVVLILLFGIIRFVLHDELMKFANEGVAPVTDKSWDTLFILVLIFYLLITAALSFWIQMDKKYGPGFLLPMILGKYRKPKEELRIFMFMDLQSSTTIAEELGHIKYSQFIRDSIMDINEVVPSHKAEIYQYVGDEVVLSWQVKNNVRDLLCLDFYFACAEQFSQRAAYYTKQYGRVPFFKAGLHVGIVTAVEVGELKRDIAYHGDTINTAARIQNLCNTFEKGILVSHDLADSLQRFNGHLSSCYSLTSLGNIDLKGKAHPVEILSVDQCLTVPRATPDTTEQFDYRFSKMASN